MHKKGLFSKMIATYVLIISISFIILATFLSLWFQGYFFEARKKQLLTECQTLSNTAIQHLEGNASLDKTNNILEYVSNYISADIILTDRYGYGSSVSNEKDKSFLGKQILTKDLERLRLGEFVEKKYDLKGKVEKDIYTYEIPIFNRYSFYGTIVINTSMKWIKTPLKKVYEIIWISAILAIITSSIIIYHFSKKIITNPLSKINNVADKIAKGEVGIRANVYSDDEIGELAKSFNSMADSLEEVENNRRVFISNLSHELRSPITSIKGFICGIIDGVIPKDKHNYYLSIAYEEIQRLTRLINDLLDLASMDAGKFTVNIKRYDINEIIRLSIIKFEQVIKSKKIKVNVWISEDSLYVMADRDKIIQVTTNLIDNAIKYVKEYGNIEITTKVKGKKVFVCIYNDGPNISQEDAKYIWERFYKGDKSRTSKISTGLGLSIVRRIITQHGEDIWLDNKENKGVKFIFTLKKVDL